MGGWVGESGKFWNFSDGSLSPSLTAIGNYYRSSSAPHDPYPAAKAMKAISQK
jgi:hypothetical protein